MFKNKFSRRALLAAAYLFVSTSFVCGGELVPETNLGEPEIQGLLNDIYDGTFGKISDEEKAQAEKDGSSTTYGEMTVKGFLELLDRAKHMYPDIFENEDEVVFFDIGSGRGLVPMMFSLKTNFQKYIGIEIAQTRHKEAMQGLNALKAKYPKFASFASKVHFVGNDIFKESLEKLAKEHAPKVKNPRMFIWISSLCFPEVVMKNLVPKIEKEAPKGTIIFTSQALPVGENSPIQLIEINHFEMTWVRDSGKKSKTHMYMVDSKDSPRVKEMRVKAQGEETYNFIEKRLGEPVTQPTTKAAAA